MEGREQLRRSTASTMESSADEDFTGSQQPERVDFERDGTGDESERRADALNSMERAYQGDQSEAGGAEQQTGPQEMETAGRVEGEEQFGDIDWSFGFGDPNEDEVEQFVDETVGEEGREAVRENISEPLREAGQEAKEADLLGPAPEEPASARVMDGDYEGVPDTRDVDSSGNSNQIGPGEAAGNLAIAGANIAEAAPMFPAAVLEGTETAGYLLAGTPVGGGSEEEFDERAEEVGTAAAALAREEVERAKENPGEVAGEALLSFGAGRAVGAAGRAATGSRTLSVADADAARAAGRIYSGRARRASPESPFLIRTSGRPGPGRCSMPRPSIEAWVCRDRPQYREHGAEFGALESSCGGPPKRPAVASVARTRWRRSETSPRTIVRRCRLASPVRTRSRMTSPTSPTTTATAQTSPRTTTSSRTRRGT